MSGKYDEFERELGVALRRVDAPEGFADEVMDRVRRSGTVRRFPGPREVWVGSLAASLVLGALLFGGAEHRRAAEERVRATRDFARSEEITEQAMEMTRERLVKAGVVVD